MQQQPPPFNPQAQGVPQQGMPQQGMPQQGYPQQGYPQQGMPQQGYPQQQGYAPQPGQPMMVQQGGMVMVPVQQVMMVMSPQFQWASGPMDMCAGGAGLCLYATFCTPCAAGEVAVAADRSYAMACCVAPVLGHLAHSDALRDLIEACFWMGDRRALVQKYGIDDSELNQPCQLPSAFCLMTCCPQCLLVQELHHVRSVAEGTAPGPPGFAKVAPVLVQQSMS